MQDRHSIKLEDDPMINDYLSRRDSDEASPIDIANAAFERAEQSFSIFTGAEEISPENRVALLTEVENVRSCARHTAGALKIGAEDVAASFAEEAVKRSAAVDAFDSVRLDGLNRAAPFADNGQVKLR